MAIKDIVNRDNVNLENCDQEPIHVPGSIQPHGCLLAADRNRRSITFCSGNSEEYIGIPYARLLGKALSEILDPECLQSIDELCKGPEGKVAVIRCTIEKKETSLIAHWTGPNIVLEAEQVHKELPSSDLLDLSRDLVVAMEETNSLKALGDLVAINIRKVTGYDRVMVYRFDKDYNGEVLSESRRDDLESFLGLHYPHTDIPVQARQLYIRNQLRIIVDMAYQPVPIYTNSDVNNQALDLSFSVLRSVSPIHVQYLHNMGVGATLTISLVLRGKLWGLIACHHYSAKYLPYDVRMSARLLGHFITSQIDSKSLNEEYDIRNKATQAADYFGSKKYELNRASIAGMVADANILAVCNADGAAVVMQDTIYTSGAVPDAAAIQKIARALKGRREVAANSLSGELKAIALSGLPGLLYYSLNNHTTDSVIWFRKETLHDVNWAGDPARSIEKDRNGLSPRKSFDLWKQTVKDHSKPWLDPEIKAASNFANILERHLNAVLLTEEEEKQRKLAKDLMQTNAELENINYISTHDLQEPLRKIQMTASVLLGNKDENFSDQALEKIGKMNQFAGRMQHLIKDILKYTQLNYNEAGFEPTDLKPLLEQLSAEMAEALQEKQAAIVLAPLPAIQAVPFLIRQMFTNLIVNSLKFSDPARPCRIYIAEDAAWQTQPAGLEGALSDYYIVKYSDNGTGFEAENNDKIFRIFTRLTVSKEAAGSGIGLAICRKIMQTHGGFITAHGEPGAGATFRIFFRRQAAALRK